MMKRMTVFLLALLYALAGVTGQGAREVLPADAPAVSLAVLQGPTGFAMARVLDTGVEGLDVHSEVLPSPQEAVARMASGELDFVLLPANLAAVVYNRGLPYHPAAVTGLGMNFLMSRDPAVSSWEDLRGRQVHVPGRGATPDYMISYILQQKELSGSVSLDYSVTSAAQLAQLIIAGSLTFAVLPEPFATAAQIRGAGDIIRSLDFQEAWKEIQGTEDIYPMTILMVRSALHDRQPKTAAAMLEAVEDSITWVLEHPHEASVIIEQFGILSSSMAEPAIPNSNLVYQPIEQAQHALRDFFQVLMGFNPASIGGSLPDEGFYRPR